VVGGASHAGGVMSYVKTLTSSPIPGVSQSIWKHRECLPLPAASPIDWVCEGAARRTDASLPLDLIGAARDVSPLVSWVRRNPEAILYAHSRMGLVSAALAAWRTNAPLMMHMHARAKRPGLYRCLWRWSHATVLFNSRQTSEHYGCNAPKERVIMPPIPWPAAPSADGASTPARIRYVAASQFVPGKNLHLIVDAFEHLMAGGLDAELVLFGNSPEPADPGYQKRLVERVRSNPAVRLMGWDPDWSRQLRPSDIFLHAAWPDAFGIVMLEAFARGCRLVVLPETFLNDLPAPLNALGIERAERLDASAFSEVMRKATQNAHVPGGYWEPRRSVREWFSVEASNARLAALYRSLVANRRNKS
jgi:glycosyltransferase involved in cell wall biosynthesis